MKTNVKRAILLILVAVILFSTSMAVPALNHSKWRDLMQGGALGLMLAGIISIVKILAEYNSQSN